MMKNPRNHPFSFYLYQSKISQIKISLTCETSLDFVMLQLFWGKPDTMSTIGVNFHIPLWYVESF